MAGQNRHHQSIKDVSPLLYVLLISDLNVLIMNYLVHQGYPSSAVSFAREANLALSKESIDSITSRMKIRNKIHAGEIEDAIHDINTINPQVLHPLCLSGNDYTFVHHSVYHDDYDFSLQNELILLLLSLYF
jgi:hypothetical protein